MKKLLAAAALAFALVCVPVSSVLSETLAERRFVANMPVATVSAFLDQEQINHFVQWGENNNAPLPENIEPTSGILIISEVGVIMVLFSVGQEIVLAGQIPPRFVEQFLQDLKDANLDIVFFPTLPGSEQDVPENNTSDNL